MHIPPRDTDLPILLQHPLLFVRRYPLAVAVLFAGALADAWTTMITLGRFGAEAELHLVQRWIVHAMGVAAGVPVAKLLQLGFVLPVAAWWRPWCRWMLALSGVLYALAAVNNHFLLL